MKTFAGALLVLFLVPSFSFAATTASQQAQIDSIRSQIAQLQAQLDALLGTVKTVTLDVATFTIPVSQHLDEVGGGLRVTFLGYEHFKNAPASTTLAKPLGKFLLDYSMCKSTFCPDPTHPTMTTELWQGQTTHYLNYDITLTQLGTSTATFTVVKS